MPELELPGLLSDDARDGTAERPDELDRQGYARHMAGVLDNVRAQSESTVLGLIGDWGSGKSSILEMLQRVLREPWRVATFNPWTYPDTASLHRGFFAELTTALPKEARPGNARKRIGEFARTVSPLGKIGGLVGLDVEGLIKAGGEFVAGDASASAAKKAAEAALRDAQLPVLMVVDDLDRLTPDELLETLKLVRLVGRLPHVYYLLSYDERTLLDVLRRTAVTGDDENRARSYLEKIVQVRLDMPVLRASQRARLLNNGLDTIGAASSLSLTSEDESRLGNIYFDVLDRRLSTPRSITRFLGQIQAFYPLVHGEVDFVDFFLVSWLRTQEPGVYRMLQTERDDLLGRRFSPFASRDPAAQVRRRELWDERLRAAHVREADSSGVVRVLSALFPEVEAAFATGQQFAQARQRSTPKAISHMDYFDRYVSFGVPQEDISDADVLEAIRDLETAVDTQAVGRLGQEIAHETARAMRKIEALREGEAPLPERALFELIARSSRKINRQRSDIFDNPWLSAVRGGAVCLASMGTESANLEVTRLGGVDGLVEFTAEAVRLLKPRDADPATSLLPAGYDFSVVKRAASAVIGSWLGEHAADSPLDEGAMTLFWTWRVLDPEAAKGWVVGQVETGRWTMAETMGAFTSTSVPIGVPNPVASLGDFDVRDVDEIFGIDRVFASLGAELDGALAPEAGQFRTPATHQNRVQQALFRLKQERDSRGEVQMEQR